MKQLTAQGVGADKTKDKVFINIEKLKIYATFNKTDAMSLLQYV
jgi:hypothetical protein